jgi:hypothetical protein
MSHSQITSTQIEPASRWIENRFRLRPATARTTAELAGFRITGFDNWQSLSEAMVIAVERLDRKTEARE